VAPAEYGQAARSISVAPNTLIRWMIHVKGPNLFAQLLAAAGCDGSRIF
jgi:hypothetical protein